MSRSFKSTSGARPSSQSAAIAQAQQIAASQMGGDFSVGGTSLSGTTSYGRTGSSALASTLARTQQSRPTSGVTRPSTLTRPAASRRVTGMRGSAAPAGGNDLIDLSAFGGDLNMNLSGGAPTSTAADAPAALENEYIVNLQQQVYFLELELNLLKKAGGGGGSTNPTGLRGSGAPGGGGESSAMNDANVPDAPLDDVMLSLREKYVRMEAEFKKDMAELKNENADLRSRARMRELEIANLKQLHTQLANETAEWKSTAQDHQSTLLDHQLANEQMILKLTARLEKREAKLDKVQEELIHLKATHKVTLENYATEREEYTKKWNEREAQMDDLNQAYLREKSANHEWAERFRQSNEAKLTAHIQELEQDALRMESSVKTSQLKAEQAEKNRASALESLDRIMEENETLRSEIQALNAEKRAIQEKEARDRASKTFWSTELASLQQQLEATTTKLDKAQAKYADAKQVKKQLKDELIQSRIYLDELSHRLTEEQDAHAATRAAEATLSESTRELKRDLQLKTEELQTLMTKYVEVRTRRDDLQRERDGLDVQLTELKAQFDVAEAMKALKSHEFVTLAHSNLKAAGFVEDLVKKIDKVRTIEAKKTRAAERERRNDDLYERRSSSPSSSRTGTPPPLRASGSRRHHASAASSSSVAESSFDDSRPTTQETDFTRTDSRPETASSLATAESSFDGI